MNLWKAGFALAWRTARHSFGKDVLYRARKWELDTDETTRFEAFDEPWKEMFDEPKIGTDTHRTEFFWPRPLLTHSRQFLGAPLGSDGCQSQSKEGREDSGLWWEDSDIAILICGAKLRQPAPKTVFIPGWACLCIAELAICMGKGMHWAYSEVGLSVLATCTGLCFDREGGHALSTI